MLAALDKIKTPYVLLMLDDFFLREPVNLKSIEQIVDWMDADEQIGYFNCDVTRAECDLEVGHYPGFRRLPAGNRYTLNMQAAIWRTGVLRSYWRRGVSPWDWEERCNVKTIDDSKHKFYSALTPEDAFMEYGHVYGGWGVYQGKWCKEDIVPFFEKEGIKVDYNQRGFFEESKKRPYLQTSISRQDRYQKVYNCLGGKYLLPYFIFCRRCNLFSKKNHCAVDEDYFHYLQRKADLQNKTGKKLLFGPMQK